MSSKYPQLENIPADIVINNDMINELTEIYQQIGKLDASIDTIPDSDILINTLPLLESKSSSEIEQIVTTHDELFMNSSDINLSPQSKEVQTYAKALKMGCEEVKETGLITINLLVNIANMVNGNDAGIRRQAGTSLKNENGDIIYTPPQNYDDIVRYLSNLENFINTDTSHNKLIKMAMIHYYFETIHPFYDGNGRVGRILNILYLIKEKILSQPVLYLSGAIIKYKSLYYSSISNITKHDDWDSYIKYIFGCLSISSSNGLITIYKMRSLISETKIIIRENEPKIYSHELLNTLFAYPYTKIEYVENVLEVSRQTAAKYLNKLVALGVLDVVKVGRNKYYVNTKLLDLFKNIDL